MKRLFAFLTCVVLMICIAGCATKPDFPSIPADTTQEIVLPSPVQPSNRSMNGVITTIRTESYVAEDGTQLFYRRYPNFQLLLQNSQIEPLLRSNLQERMENFLNDSDSIYQMAQQDYLPDEAWYPYFATVSYTPMRIDAQVLSMYCLYRSQTNEIHPSYNTSSVTYDLNTGHPLLLGDILVDNWDSQALINKICDALANIADNLDSDYQSIIQQRFSKGASGSTAWYFSETGLCFYFAPYDIAPYFVGVVTAEIPYTQLPDLLRTEYLPKETPSSNGELRVDPSLQSIEEQFSFIASMATSSQGESVLVYPTADIYAVTVQVKPLSPTANAPAYTLFTANHLPKDYALKISTDFSDPGQSITITYRSGNDILSANLVYDWENDCYRLIYG